MFARIVSVILTFAPLISNAATTKTFVYCSESSPTSLNSVLASDATSADVGRHIFSNLLEFERGGTALVPGAAESWRVSPDGLRYTFVIRKGVKFHSSELFQPSRELNADDLVFTFERFLKVDHPYHKVGGRYPIVSSFGLERKIKGVKKLDDRQFEIELVSPYASFATLLAVKPIGVIHSKEYADKMLKAGTPQLFDQKPIGTGPFQLRSFERDSKLILTAFDGYFLGKAPIDRLVFSFVAEPNVRLQKLYAKECHLIFQPDPRDVAAIEKRPGFRVEKSPGLNIGYLAMNTSKPPLNDVRVRRAILLGLNRKSYLDAIYQNQAELLSGPLPIISWGASEMPGFKFDPVEAKKLIDSANIKQAEPIKLWPLPISRPYLPKGKKLAEMMQADLAKIGLKTTIEEYEWSSYLSKADAGQHELLQIGWNAQSTDPDFYLFPLLTCAKGTLNHARWCHPKFEALVSKARELHDQSTDQGSRKKLYKEALAIFAEEVPWVPLASGHVYHALVKEVRDFKVGPDGGINLYGVSL